MAEIQEILQMVILNYIFKVWWYYSFVAGDDVTILVEILLKLVQLIAEI